MNNEEVLRNIFVFKGFNKNQNDYFYGIGKIRKDFKFLILKGSWIGFKNYENIDENDIKFKLLNQFLNNNLIIKDFENNRYYFKEDVLLNSCSLAAKFIFGNSKNEINGFKRWKEKQSENSIEFFINTKVNKKNNSKKIESSIYFLDKDIDGKKICAKAFLYDDLKRVKVFKNSYFSKELYSHDLYEKLLIKAKNHPKWSMWALNCVKRKISVFEKLLKNKTIILENNNYIFKEDFIFNSKTGVTNFFFGFRTYSNLSFNSYWGLEK